MWWRSHSCDLWNDRRGGNGVVDETAVKLSDKGDEVLGGNVDLVAEIAEQLSLHLVDFAQRKEALTNDGPALVAVRVVAAGLTGEHQGRDEEAVTTGTTCRGESSLQPLEEEEGLVRDG